MYMQKIGLFNSCRDIELMLAFCNYSYKDAFHDSKRCPQGSIASLLPVTMDTLGMDTLVEEV